MSGPIVRSPATSVLGSTTPWRLGVLIDVGSTYTKAFVVAPSGDLLARAEARTTVGTDVLEGVGAALDGLPAELRGPHDWALLCSSAAGGLRMASVGLTASLSGQAGTLAALGAGARIVASESGPLDTAALERIAAARPHLVLLSGGTDGGNRDALLHNADALGALDAGLGFIVAGNADVADRAAEILRRSGRDALVVANVFPAPGRIDVAPTREAVRELFLRHITRAKGLERLTTLLRCDCEPTPLAVSRALWNLPGTSDDPVVLVDVGGATTDVHSVGGRQYVRRSVDLPSPEVMRTVEGDLGMRWGAPGVVLAAGARMSEHLAMSTAELQADAERRQADPGFVPTTEQDRRVEEALARAAVTTAIERHSGRVVVRQQPWGTRYRVAGKDLRRARLLIATGGVFRHLPDPVSTLRSAVAAVDSVLAPSNPTFAIDLDYRLYAIGLVARYDRRLASRMASSLLELMPA